MNDNGIVRELLGGTAYLTAGALVAWICWRWPHRAAYGDFCTLCVDYPWQAFWAAVLWPIAGLARLIFWMATAKVPTPEAVEKRRRAKKEKRERPSEAVPWER